VWFTKASFRRRSGAFVFSGGSREPQRIPRTFGVGGERSKIKRTSLRFTACRQHDRLIRLGLENQAQIMFAIAEERRHSEGSVSYFQETRILLDRVTEKVSADDSNHDIVTAVSLTYECLRTTHTADDVRGDRMFKRRSGSDNEISVHSARRRSRASGLLGQSDHRARARARKRAA